MRTRVAYWTTSCLEPEWEAVSKEVLDLAEYFGNGSIVAVSPHVSLRYRWKERSFGINSRLYHLLRVLAPIVEGRSDINHIYSEISPWVLYRNLKNKPLVLTIASEKGFGVSEFLERCKYIAVQTERMKESLIDAGLDKKRIGLIYPGIDLGMFSARASARKSMRVKLLFATMPRARDELEGRGVYFLLEMAKRFPEIDFHVLSRPWKRGYTSLQGVTDYLGGSRIENFKITNNAVSDMAAVYREHDFTVIPYMSRDGGKECPRSFIESLGCGVPVLVSDIAAISSFVSSNACGCTFAPNADGFGTALESGLRKYAYLSRNASSTAERCFDRNTTFRKYSEVYETALAL
jgi:glycosyltransferase involved in cell wall biosynthesis